MCSQKFFKLVCGFCSFNERRDVVPFCESCYSECASTKFATGPRNGKQKWVPRGAKIRARWVMKSKAILKIQRRLKQSLRYKGVWSRKASKTNKSTLKRILSFTEASGEI